MNKNVIFLFALMLISGCTQVPTKDITIEAQLDPKANFSAYKTYAWLGSAAILNDSSSQWEKPGFDADAEIKFLIDRDLRGRGLSESSTAPDLIAAFAVGIDMDALDLKLNPESKMNTLENVPQGGLVVVLVDSNSGFLIWTGVATGEIQQDADAKMMKARLDYAVTQMLKKLPR